MKKALFLLSFLLVNFLASAQTMSAPYEARLDSTVITTFSISKSKGHLNIHQNKSWLDHRIHINIIRSLRPVAQFDYESVAAFNKSTFTTELRRIAQPGDKINIEFAPRSGSSGAAGFIVIMVLE
jgi:hypothetical protein